MVARIIVMALLTPVKADSPQPTDIEALSRQLASDSSPRQHGGTRMLEMFGGKSTAREAWEHEAANPDPDAIPEECRDVRRRLQAGVIPTSEDAWYKVWKLRVQCWMLESSNRLGLQGCANALGFRLSRNFEDTLVQHGKHGPKQLSHPHDAIREPGCEWVESLSIPDFPAFGNFEFKLPSVSNLAPWTPWGWQKWQEMTLKEMKRKQDEMRPSATFGREKEYTGNVYTPRDLLGPGGKLPLDVQQQGVELLRDQSSLPPPQQSQGTSYTSMPVAAGAGVGFAVGAVLTLAILGCHRRAGRGRMALQPAQQAAPMARRDTATKSATPPLESA